MDLKGVGIVKTTYLALRNKQVVVVGELKKKRDVGAKMRGPCSKEGHVA